MHPRPQLAGRSTMGSFCTDGRLVKACLGSVKIMSGGSSSRHVVVSFTQIGWCLGTAALIKNA